MRRTDVSPERPLTIAHRGANTPGELAEAERIGVDLIEADVRWHRGRLEVRHTKTMGPLPLLWDRWSLHRGWTKRLVLEELLAHVSPHSELMLDLKPGDHRFTQAVIHTMRDVAPGREYSVCSQLWYLLEPFLREPGVRVIHSAGTSRALRGVLDRFREDRDHAVSVHMRLLSPAVVAAVRRHAGVLMTWPVNDAGHAERLLNMGVNGIISDSLPLLKTLVERQGERRD